MAGETDLRTLLGSLRPKLSDTAYAFATLSSADVPAGIHHVGTFRESEGLTFVAALDEIAGTDLVHAGPFAMITLTVHSSLSAVGLTASVSSALAEEGISANFVAAYYHDHLFVPWDVRHTAMEILQRLSRSVKA